MLLVRVMSPLRSGFWSFFVRECYQAPQNAERSSIPSPQKMYYKTEGNT